MDVDGEPVPEHDPEPEPARDVYEQDTIIDEQVYRVFKNMHYNLLYNVLLEMISKLTAQNDKNTHILYHYHYFIIICIHTLQADPVQERDASFDLTTEDASPLGSALNASFELTRNQTQLRTLSSHLQMSPLSFLRKAPKEETHFL